MKKNITMKDIAKQAGVSVATVSYVINNRTDQRISESTRKKILQIVNLLDYTPNPSAQSLATNKTFLIALYTTPETSLLKRSEQMLVIEILAKVLKNLGYNLNFKYSKDINKLNQVDAILCYDINLDYFYKIGDKNLIPLLAIDTLVDIPWFFQVCSNYDKIKAYADKHFGLNNYSFLALSPNNETLKHYIEDTFSNVIFVDDFHELVSLTGNIAYHQSSLIPFFKEHKHALYIASNYEKKLEKICSCIELAVSRVPDLEHRYYI